MSRMCSPQRGPGAATKHVTSRSQSSTKATSTRSPLQQRISKLSEHQRRLGFSVTMTRRACGCGLRRWALEEQPVPFHDAVDALRVHALPKLAVQERRHSPVPVARQFAHELANAREQQRVLGGFRTLRALFLPRRWLSLGSGLPPLPKLFQGATPSALTIAFTGNRPSPARPTATTATRSRPFTGIGFAYPFGLTRH